MDFCASKCESSAGTGKARGTLTAKSPIPNPSSFLLLIDPPAAGAWNMAVDETLLEAAAADGQCTLRFYRWEKPTLSLGYFQTYVERWQHEASSRSTVVRRTSGGGAILHDVELTYSVAVPSHHPLAIGRLEFYQAMHTTLIETLAEWHIEASLFAPSEATAPRSGKNPSTAPCRPPFLCFQRRSPGDVLVGQTKVAGSAQRRCRGALLQHGIVLLARSVAAPELDGLEEVGGRAIAPEELIEAWLIRLAKIVPGIWRRDQLAEERNRRAATLAAEKYASITWTESRFRDRVP